MQLPPRLHHLPVPFAAAMILAACTGHGPRPSQSPTDDAAALNDQPSSRKGPASLEVASDTSVVTSAAPRALSDPPLATKPARPLEFIVDKPDTVLEDTCTACGGAVWRTQLREISAYPQIFGDNLLLHEKPNGGAPKILLLNATTGAPLWMRTLKSTEPSSSLYLQGLHFLADGTIAAMIEENRGGRANRKVVLLGMDGSRITELDYDPGLSGLYLHPLDSGFLVYGRTFASNQDPVEHTYLALHDAKGRPIGAWYEEKDTQAECVLDRSRNALICAFMFRSKMIAQRVELDATTLKVKTRTERPVDWLRPFFVDGLFYHGVLEKPGNNEWSIFRVDPSGHEKLVLKTKRTLSPDLGQARFLIEYNGRERRYFPVFSTSEEPAHVIVAPQNAQVNLGPGGDAFTSYEGIFARWAAEKNPKGGTIATMKLLTR